jgi:hypothetical protein
MRNSCKENGKLWRNAFLLIGQANLTASDIARAFWNGGGSMYTGKRFRLGEAVLAIERIDGRHRAVPIPSGETVLILSGPKPNDMRMVDVQWGERRFIMFAEDSDSWKGTQAE